MYVARDGRAESDIYVRKLPIGGSVHPTTDAPCIMVYAEIVPTTYCRYPTPSRMPDEAERAGGGHHCFSFVFLTVCLAQKGHMPLVRHQFTLYVQ
jgi:hypothetical protein